MKLYVNANYLLPLRLIMTTITSFDSSKASMIGMLSCMLKSCLRNPYLRSTKPFPLCVSLNCTLQFNSIQCLIKGTHSLIKIGISRIHQGLYSLILPNAHNSNSFHNVTPPNSHVLHNFSLWNNKLCHPSYATL